MNLPIVMYGNPILRDKALDIEQNTDLSELIANMFLVMRISNGVGLAAPQIGKSIRLFVIEEKGLKKVFINPNIVKEFGKDCGFEEGCLSIPTIRAKVIRKESLTIQYFNEQWEFVEEDFTGIVARIIQHEYDHLNGVLFVDRLTGLSRFRLDSRLKNIAKRYS